MLSLLRSCSFGEKPSSSQSELVKTTFLRFDNRQEVHTKRLNSASFSRRCFGPIASNFRRRLEREGDAAFLTIFPRNKLKELPTLCPQTTCQQRLPTRSLSARMAIFAAGCSITNAASSGRTPTLPTMGYVSGYKFDFLLVMSLLSDQIMQIPPLTLIETVFLH